jgi:nitrate reductase delta subunit
MSLADSLHAADVETCDAIADLLEYPSSDWDRRLAHAVAITAERNPALLAGLRRFLRAVEPLSIPALQELYTVTFDLNPVCSLDVGYHLFGENYKRGEFLANLREIESGVGLDTMNQLPDYLPILLRLIGRLEEVERRKDLIAECIVPALARMCEAMPSDNPYRSLIELVRKSVQMEVPEQEAAASSNTRQEAWSGPELYQLARRAVTGMD